MKHSTLIAALVLQAGLATACAATPSTPATVEGSLFCQADTASDTIALKEAASGFCGDLQAAFSDALGSPVVFVPEGAAEWVISVNVSAYRADAIILHAPSAQNETMQFDIMDASLTPDRLRPFARSTAKLAMDLRAVTKVD